MTAQLVQHRGRRLERGELESRHARQHAAERTSACAYVEHGRTRGYLHDPTQVRKVSVLLGRAEPAEAWRLRVGPCFVRVVACGVATSRRRTTHLPVARRDLGLRRCRG